MCIRDSKDQYKANLRLALPVVLTQLGQILTQVADNLMVGRYGGSDPTPLAAVSFGGAVFFILFIAAIGIALGMTPLVGELYAQGDREKSSGLLQNGILFYGLLGVAMAAVQYAVIPLMYHCLLYTSMARSSSGSRADCRCAREPASSSASMALSGK